MSSTVAVGQGVHLPYSTPAGPPSAAAFPAASAPAVRSALRELRLVAFHGRDLLLQRLADVHHEPGVEMRHLAAMPTGRTRGVHPVRLGPVERSSHLVSCE